MLACQGKKESQNIKGSWTLAGEQLTLKVTKMKNGASLDGAVLKPARCKGSAVEGSCLAAEGAGLFHGGVPEVTAGFTY